MPSGTGTKIPNPIAGYTVDTCVGCIPDGDYALYFTDSETNQIRTATGTGVAYLNSCGTVSYSGSVTQELTEEYTTDELITRTIADLPGDYPLTTAGSSRNLSDTEISFSVREGRYYWRFPVPNAGYGRRYVIQWVERFQPEDEEAAPTDTIRCEEWDGIVPEGYDPDDPETWPELGPYDAPIPEADGLFNVGQYTDPEDPDTYVSGGFLVACKGACP